MTLVEIGIQNFISRFSFVSPYTVKFTVYIHELAFFWLTTLGCDDERSNERAYVLSTIANYSDRFSRVNTIDECKNVFESWVFDSVNQELYVNLGLNYNPLFTPIEYLKSVGFCDTSVVYVDDVAFLPVVSSSPNLSQEQDLINYDALAFNTGSISVSNESGSLDYMRDMSLFSNDVAISYLDYDGRSEYSRNEVEPLARYLLEDLEIGKTRGKITLQDNRKANNVKLPNILFDSTTYPNIDESIIDNPIPLLFGLAIIPAICINGKVETGNVEYQAAQYLSTISKVQVYYDDAWHEVPTVSTNPSLGSFVLSDYYGRGGTDGPPRKARIGYAVGYPSSKPHDVISKLEELGNGIPYTDSFYNTSEIESEESSISPISLYIDEQKELNEIIRLIQEGCSNRFRYEFNADGLRTIRIDNLSRASSMFVSRSEILESDTMDIYTDKPTIAASIKVTYGNDFSSEKRNNLIDSSASESVASSIRERPQIEFETYLATRELAASRAALEVSRLGQVRRFCDITLRGKQYLFLRIYDIITVELIDEFRKWVGTWKCQILKVEPDMVNKNNKVKLLLVEKVSDIDDGESLRVTTTGAIRITKSGTDNLRVTK